MRLFCCVCSPRSGSTLLTRMLNSHSKIAAPYEIPVAKLFFGTDTENLSLDKTIQISQLLKIDVSRAVSEPGFLFQEILKAEGKDGLVVKEPANALHLPRLRISLGDVPLIWIARDVRQVMQSKALKSSKINLSGAASLWLRHNREINKYRRLFSKVLLVRYEELVEQPEKLLERTVGWMGYQYEPGMEEYWNFEHSDNKLSLWDGREPEKSTWAKEIGEGKINKNYKEPSEEVLKIYEGSPALKAMNERLGYK